MVKLIVFDLDGVLVSTKKLHYDAFNKALAEIDPKYVTYPYFEQYIYKLREKNYVYGPE